MVGAQNQAHNQTELNSKIDRMVGLCGSGEQLGKVSKKTFEGQKLWTSEWKG